jgi:hypothetical protein
VSCALHSSSHSKRCPLSSKQHAGSFRGRSDRKLRPADQPSNGNGNKELQCTLYLKQILLEPEKPTGDLEMDFANARTVSSWSCEIDESDEKVPNGNAFGYDNPSRQNFKRFYDLKGIDKKWLDERAISGSSVLKVKGSYKKDKDLEVPKGATYTIEDIADNRRRLAKTLGTLKTKVVRVTGTSASTGLPVPPTPSAAKLLDDVFLDNASLATRYEACSKGALKVEVGTGTIAELVAQHIQEITISTDPTAANGKDAMQTAVMAQIPKGDNDVVMFCQPPGSSGWIAYAFLNHWASFYNNNWCTYVSAQMHEVGHSMVSNMDCGVLGCIIIGLTHIHGLFPSMLSTEFASCWGRNQ